MSATKRATCPSMFTSARSWITIALLLRLPDPLARGFEALVPLLPLGLFELRWFLPSRGPFADAAVLFHDRVVVVLDIAFDGLDFGFGQDRHDLLNLFVRVLLLKVRNQILDRYPTGRELWSPAAI